MTSAFLKEIENDLHAIVAKVKSATMTVVTDIDTEIQPGIAYLKANVPAAAIKIGESLLASEMSGTPWPGLVALLISQSEVAGIKLGEQAAGIVLNYAQSNLLATGALPPVVPAPAHIPAPEPAPAPIPAPEPAPAPIPAPEPAPAPIPAPEPAPAPIPAPEPAPAPIPAPEPAPAPEAPQAA